MMVPALRILAALNATQVEIKILNSQYANFANIKNPNIPIVAFTLAELNNGEIQYVNGNTNNRPTFDFQFFVLGTNYTIPQVITGNTLLNHAPKLNNPLGTFLEKVNVAFTHILPNDE